MGQSLSGMMEVLRRLFMGKAQVRSLNCEVREAPQIFSAARLAAVSKCETISRNPRVFAPRPSLATVKGEAARVERGDLVRRAVFAVPSAPKVHRANLVRPVTLVLGNRIPTIKARTGRLRISRSRATVRKGNEIMAKLPQRRRNLLPALRTRPRFEGGAVLALFAPVLQEGIQKSVLDKGSGDLLVWMDPWTRSRKPFRVFLVRRVQGTPPLSWVWLPIEGESRIVGGGPPKV